MSVTREELSKLKKIKQEIEQIKRELENVELDTTKYVHSSDSVKGSSKHFPYTEQIYKIEGGSCDYEAYYRKVHKIQNRLNRKLDELMDEKDRLSEYIYGLNDSDIRQILTYKYINGLTWEQIGTEMGYSKETVRKKHDKFLKYTT